MRARVSSPPGATRTASDEVLLAMVRAGSPGEAAHDAACAELVHRYDNIVQGAAARYRNSPELAEDLAQVGYVGLMKAINGFDPELGGSFAAYAAPTVAGEIKRHFRDRRWQIRVQRPAQELRLRIREVTGELTQQLARTPTAAELASRLGVTESEVADAQLAARAFETASLDAPAIPGDQAAGTLGDLLGAEDPAIDEIIDLTAVWRHYSELPAREQRLLMLRFWGNHTQAEIASRLGISQMHVSRLLTRSLAYLRARLTDQPASLPPAQADDGQQAPPWADPAV